MDSKRLDYRDYAKGLGIILVVAGHLIGEAEMEFAGAQGIRMFIYQFHMPLFFMISGVTLELSFYRHGENGAIRLVKRALMLLVSYLFWSGIYQYLIKFSGRSVNLHEELCCILTLRGRAPIWFLAALSAAEFAFIILHRFLFRSEKKYAALPLLAIIMMILCTKLLTQLNLSFDNLAVQYLTISLIRLFPSLVFLISGSLLFRFLHNYSNNTVLMSMGALLLVLTAALTVLFRNSINMHLAVFGNVFLFYINAWLGAAGTMFLSKGICGVIKTRILPSIGRNSCGIMVFHYPPYFLTFHYAQVVCTLLGISNRFLAFAVCLAISVLALNLLTEIIKKYQMFL